jgi:hypothetical protein
VRGRVLWSAARGLLDLVAPGAVPVRGIIVPRYRDTAYPENSSKLYSKAIRQLNVGRAIAMAIAGRVRARSWYDRACNGRSAPRVPSRGRGEDPELQQTYSKSQSSYCFTPRSIMQSSFLCKVRAPPGSTVLCCGAGPCRSRWVQPRPDPARLVSPLYSSAPHEPARRPSHASLLGAHRAHPRSRRVKEL